MLKRIFCLLLSVALVAPMAGADAKSVFAAASPSVVVVLAADKQGSGVVVGEGIVVTNCHVIEEAVTANIKQAADAQISESYLMDAEVITRDEDNDLCFLFAEDLTVPPAAQVAKFGKAKSLVIGEEIYAIGAPKGLDLSLSRGIVAQLRGIKGKAPIVQTDAAISPGSSGGGLFNDKGELVGITTYKRVDGENLNFAMPVESVVALLQSAHHEAGEKKEQAAIWHACVANLQYQCVLDLAQQREEQISGVNYRASIYYRLSIYTEIANIQAKAGNLNDAKTILDDVLHEAKLISDANDRAIIFNDIASVQAEIGYLNDAKLSFNIALHAAEQIDDTLLRTYRLRNIAEAQIKANSINDAEITLNHAIHAAKKIDYAIEIVSNLTNIAIAQHEMGNSKNAAETISEALHVARQINVYYLRVPALVKIAGTQAEIGSIDDAYTTLRQIKKPYERALVRNKIALAQYEAGDFGGAKKSVDNALYEANQISFANNALEAIATTQSKFGDINGAKITFNNALHAVNQDDDTEHRDYYLGGIASAQAEVGNINDAIITAQQINKSKVRIDALIDIASTQADTGNVNGAKITFSNAISAAKQIDGSSPFNFRDSALRSIAQKQAQVGNFKDAMKTARSINDDFRKTWALIEIAEALAGQ